MKMKHLYLYLLVISVIIACNDDDTKVSEMMAGDNAGEVAGESGGETAG